MSCQLTEVSIRGLRKVHFEQLLRYIDWAKQEGAYYGDKKSFGQRHLELKAWVDEIIKALSED